MQEVVISYFNAFNPILIGLLVFVIIWEIVIKAFKGGF